MSQLTVQLDENAENALQELQKFFGTKSKAAALRNALALARIVAPAAKDRTLILRDQNAGEDLKIAITS